MSEQWTPELRRAWDTAWDQPHMQAGLRELKDRCRVKGSNAPLPPGYDALVLAAQAFAFASGQSNAIEEIERMRKEVKVVKDLPPAFQAPRPKDD